MAYICEKAVGAERACDFRSGKIILQRPIEVEQMKKLLIEGKTDLLHRFISKKGRPFSAFLVKGPDNKVSFEFAPKVAKIPTKAPPKTAAKAAAADDDDAPVKVAKAKAPAKAKAAPRARKTAT
jgi:DNA topoisomerase-3